ncbi:GNAT family N-acetyltransferase [Flavobacterium luteum]|uniref:N-acetyltransferase n=1 Tax=Flavobacterium luteum TaxID=2026654 RepID=A0A7J5AMM7_9FLAO|nr:GNAT family N-acetyltransferase [Flavobacterium luteum]KAB1158239.1 N-acetyltransferase [Flavobacterium luteum]
MNVTIKSATTNDLPAILAIVNYSILHTTSNYNYDIQTIEIQKQWFTAKKTQNFPVIVAKINGQTIGYGTYGTFREKIGYQFTVEHSVYVSENYIGKGIGKLLLNELIQLAKTNGYHTMIGAIDADNSGSIAFHKKFGFKECGIIKEAGFKFGKWLDLLFMQLILID